MTWRTPNREERQLGWLWAVLAVATLALRPLWLAAVPALPACPFRALTGLPCATCGTTRAGVALLHGDLVSALTANPGAALAGVAFLLGGALAPLWLAAGGRVPDLAAPAPAGLRVAVVAAIAANWAWVIATQG